LLFCFSYLFVLRIGVGFGVGAGVVLLVIRSTGVGAATGSTVGVEIGVEIGIGVSFSAERVIIWVRSGVELAVGCGSLLTTGVLAGLITDTLLLS